MNHAIKKDIEERDQILLYINEAITAMMKAIDYDWKLAQENLFGLNVMKYQERIELQDKLNKLMRWARDYFTNRKWEDIN